VRSAYDGKSRTHNNSKYMHGALKVTLIVANENRREEQLPQRQQHVGLSNTVWASQRQHNNGMSHVDWRSLTMSTQRCSARNCPSIAWCRQCFHWADVRENTAIPPTGWTRRRQSSTYLRPSTGRQPDGLHLSPIRYYNYCPVLRSVLDQPYLQASVNEFDCEGSYAFL